MNQHRLEVADVFRKFETQFRESHGASLSGEQRRALRAIMICRTSALGGHVEECRKCGHRLISYNSCRNRHCPKCQAAARVEWLLARQAELLPTQYFHVVFTLPQQFGLLALQNKRIVYSLLFRAASETLLEVAANPQHLGAQIGVLAVLHTWGQTLMHHPHVHCVIPGGGVSPDGARWIACRKNFFLPVRVLGRVFRGKFIDYLKQAFLQGQLSFRGDLSVLGSVPAFEQLLNASVVTDWVVYAKPPFGGPEQVLKYLARYTHRVAVSNARLVAMEDEGVTFRWKDYAHGSVQRTMTLAGPEFVRRFLLHVLPPGFMRIRHYGFLANRCRTVKLAQCRALLGIFPEAPCDDLAPLTSGIEQVDDPHERTERLQRCPVCQVGQMVTTAELEPGDVSAESKRVGEHHCVTYDSS
jgi:hypothetical protein